MTWNYRIVEVVENEEKVFVLAEVYYNSKLEPFGWCHAKLVADRMEDVEDVFRMMETAIYKPVVKPGEFVEDME